MSVKVNFNTDEFIERMKKFKKACDKLDKAIAKYVVKHKYEIIKILFEENNKRMGGNGIYEGEE